MNDIAAVSEVMSTTEAAGPPAESNRMGSLVQASAAQSCSSPLYGVSVPVDEGSFSAGEEDYEAE